MEAQEQGSTVAMPTAGGAEETGTEKDEEENAERVFNGLSEGNEETEEDDSLIIADEVDDDEEEPAPRKSGEEEAAGEEEENGGS